MMDVLKRMTHLILQYLRFYFFIFIGFAIFRTLLTSFAPEVSQWLVVLDITIFWILMVSFILRFEEVEEEKETTWERTKGTFLNIISLWFINGVLITVITRVIKVSTLASQMAINTIFGVATIMGTLRILDKRRGILDGLQMMNLLIRKSPVGMLFIFALHSGVSYLLYQLLMESGLSEYINDQVYLDAGRIFLVYLISFFSLVIYASFYWVYRDLTGEKGE